MLLVMHNLGSIHFGVNMLVSVTLIDVLIATFDLDNFAYALQMYFLFSKYFPKREISKVIHSCQFYLMIILIFSATSPL